MPVRKTHSAFIEEMKVIHPDLKVLGEYECIHKHILVKDKNGYEYLSKPGNLLQGYIPTIESAKNKEHILALKIENLLPNIKILGKYKTNCTPLLVEDELGIQYMSTPDMLIAGHRPSIQTAVDKTDAFIKKAKLIHGDKYDYSQVVYKKAHSRIKIKCPIHGYFTQLSYVHIDCKCGCPKCGNERIGRKNKYNYFSRTEYVKYCEKSGRKPYVYIIKCNNEKEKFVKIGMCSTRLSKRFSSMIPYEYQVVGKITGTPEFVYDMEKILHERYEEYEYIPLIDFPGKTECFDIKILDIINWEQTNIWN